MHSRRSLDRRTLDFFGPDMWRTSCTIVAERETPLQNSAASTARGPFAE